MKKKSKSYAPLAKIKNQLRRIHMHCPQRAKALKRCKVDVSTHECEFCGDYYYSGSSDKRYQGLVEKYPDKNVLKGKLDLDHEHQVIEPKKGYADWNTYIERLWCAAEDYNAICKPCHAEKTAKEAKERAEHGTLKRK